MKIILFLHIQFIVPGTDINYTKPIIKLYICVTDTNCMPLCLYYSSLSIAKTGRTTYCWLAVSF